MFIENNTVLCTKCHKTPISESSIGLCKLCLEDEIENDSFVFRTCKDFPEDRADYDKWV